MQSAAMQRAAHTSHTRALIQRAVVPSPHTPVNIHHVHRQNPLIHLGAVQPTMDSVRPRVLVQEASIQTAPSSPAQPEKMQPADLISQIVQPVAADMEQMNRNLKSIVGERHPMLMAAADQIFGAGGKKLRPMIVFLVARATAELAGME